MKEIRLHVRQFDRRNKNYDRQQQRNTCTSASARRRLVSFVSGSLCRLSWVHLNWLVIHRFVCCSLSLLLSFSVFMFLVA